MPAPTSDLPAPGRALRDLRRASGLSQEQLGERVGLSQSTISAIERGELDPSRGALVRVLDVLGVPADQRGTFLAPEASMPSSEAA